MKRHAHVLALAAAAMLAGACGESSEIAGPAARRPALDLAAAETGGICRAVLTQLAQRGFVDAHLLAAAKEQNAAVLQQLEAERAALQAELAEAQASLAQLESEIGPRLETILELQNQIRFFEELIAQETNPETIALYEAIIADLQAAIVVEEAALAETRAQIETLTNEIAALQAQIAAIDAQIARAGC